jgi:hypothetical protein
LNIKKPSTEGFNYSNDFAIDILTCSKQIL